MTRPALFPGAGRVLVLGASGSLGSSVARLAAAAGLAVAGTSTSGDGGLLRLDITDRAAVAELIGALRPAVVVNAAYKVSDWAACADGAANAALAAVAAGARLVHLSTDALHAGRPAPYLDDEAPTPITTYGAAKAAAETAVAAIDPGAAIVRTSLIIGDERSGQVELSLGLASGRRRGALFTDEFRRPVAVEDLAAAVLELAGLDHQGLINIAGPETLSRAQLGRLIAGAYGFDPASVKACTTAEAGLPPRPGNVLLDSSRAESLLKTRLRPATEFLHQPPLTRP